VAAPFVHWTVLTLVNNAFPSLMNGPPSSDNSSVMLNECAAITAMVLLSWSV
jgi:hypothetical protein